jgi:hypothetical protein
MTEMITIGEACRMIGGKKANSSCHVLQRDCPRSLSSSGAREAKCGTSVQEQANALKRLLGEKAAQSPKHKHAPPRSKKTSSGEAGDGDHSLRSVPRRRQHQVATKTQVEETARFYRKALWADVDAYIEIWLEKDALSSVILLTSRAKIGPPTSTTLPTMTRAGSMQPTRSMKSCES